MSVDLRLGDCIAVMKTMPDNSVDSIITDPPYHLTNNGGGPGGKGIDNAFSRSKAGATTGGFMGLKWDGGDIAHSVEMWTEALRVLKPGGHLLAFAGSRTYHRMTCAIEDAGFEIRDQIMWIYSQGFPKSRDITADMEESYNVATWAGWGTALKPSHEPICVARKPLAKGNTVAANVLQYGTGAINIDACRVPTGESIKATRNIALGSAGSGIYGAADVPGVYAQQPGGRWPANCIHDGSEEVLAAFPQAGGAAAPVKGSEPSAKTVNAFGEFAGRAPSDRVDGGGNAARFFYAAKTSPTDRHEGMTAPGPQFKYGTTLRKVSLTPTTGNNHPTVKPTSLMRYLCRLVTPPGGIVLDMFMGSGSTGKAAVLEGFNFIGIDMTPEYVEISRARITFAQRMGVNAANDPAPVVSGVAPIAPVAVGKSRKQKLADGQSDMFDLEAA